MSTILSLDRLRPAIAKIKNTDSYSELHAKYLYAIYLLMQPNKGFSLTRAIFIDKNRVVYNRLITEYEALRREPYETNIREIETRVIVDYETFNFPNRLHFNEINPINPER